MQSHSGILREHSDARTPICFSENAGGIHIDTHEHSTLSKAPINPRARISQVRSVVAIEFMTFHLEVLVAICKHTIELQIPTTVISPRMGIQRAIGRIGGSSFEKLKTVADLNSTPFKIALSQNSEETHSLIEGAGAIFIGTIPPSPKPTQPPQHSVRAQTRIQDMFTLVKRALSLDKLVYIVIHNPDVDAARLIEMLSPEDCKKISIVSLSTQTGNYCQSLFPDRFRSALIMPAIGMHDAYADDRVPRGNTNVAIAVVGEISSQRRDYESLADLCMERAWLQQQGIRIQIIGRIKPESGIENLLRRVRLPAAWIFLVKYPKLLPLWLAGILDLSMTRHSRISDKALDNAILDASCLLDLHLPHYLVKGKTSGAEGLAMTYLKPLIGLGDLKSVIANASSDTTRAKLLEQLIVQSAECSAQRRELLQQQFREQLMQDLTFANQQTPSHGLSGS